MSDNNTAGLGRVPEGQKAAYDAALDELTSNLTAYDAPPPRPAGSILAQCWSATRLSAAMVRVSVMVMPSCVRPCEPF